MLSQKKHGKISKNMLDSNLLNTSPEDICQRYNSLIKNIPGVVYRCDKDWTLMFTNGFMEKLTGFPDSDFINNNVRSIASIIYPEDIKLIEDEIKNSLIMGVPIDVEYRITHADGDIRWVHETAQIGYDSEGEISFFDGVVFDITKRRQMENDLFRSEAKYRHLVEKMNDGLAVLDYKGTITFINEKLADMMGYTKTELIDKNLRTVFDSHNWTSGQPLFYGEFYFVIFLHSITQKFIKNFPTVFL